MAEPESLCVFEIHSERLEQSLFAYLRRLRLVCFGQFEWTSEQA